MNTMQWSDLERIQVQGYTSAGS